MRAVLLGLWAGAGLLASAQAGASMAACDRVAALLQAAAGPKGLTLAVSCPERPDAAAGALQGEWTLADAPVWFAGPSRVALRRVDAPARLVSVPVVLAIRSQAWVSRRTLGVGEPVRPQDMDWREVQWPPGAIAVPGDRDAVPEGRALAALRAGDVVTQGRLAPVGTAFRGDPVVVRVRTDGVELEVPGQLTQAASVGQVARVQLARRNTALQGRLIDPHTVMVEN